MRWGPAPRRWSAPTACRQPRNANLVRREFGALPWRMDAVDYQQALARHLEIAAPLEGAPVEPAWSAALGEAMRRHGRALAEEGVAGELLDDLVGRAE